jgi:hypothetical protein
MPQSPRTPQKKNIPENYRRLEGSERRPKPGARLVGPANPKEKLNVIICVRRHLGAPPIPDQEYWSRTPPGKRIFLSHEEFATKYGASQVDLDLVASFARSRGLTVVESSIAKRTVVVSGTVSQMTAVFAVTLGRYRSSTESYRGREGYVHVPNEIADVVEGVIGLDNRRVAYRDNDPSGASLLNPPEVAGLYNFPTPADATGQTVGIFEFGGGYANSDIQTFMQNAFGPGTPTPTIVTASGTSNYGVDLNSDGEVALDIEVVASIARGAKIAMYFSTFDEAGWVEAITAAVNDTTNNPSVISVSWGAPEQLNGTTWTKQTMQKVSDTWGEAAVKGITVFFSSGDHGSDVVVGDGQAHVKFPSSSPWVTTCGGTVITNVSGSSFDEGTWNDSTGATGGGVSEFFPLPSWQQGANVPLSKNKSQFEGRGVPDVAGNASQLSGYDITADGTTSPNGGTSAVAPLYAGLLELIIAKLGERVGYLNPTLYALALDPTGTNVLRDINDPPANNQWSGEANQQTPFYTSGPGWDACTGWGVINGGALLAQLQTLFTKSCMIATDRDHYGQDEIDALRTQPGGAVVKGAFFVIVDGFTPTDLGIVDSSSLSAAPVVTFTPSTGVTNSCSSLTSDDPSFGPEIQRFRFGYDVNFGSDDTAFTFPGDSETVELSTTYQGLPAAAQVTFIKQPDPYIMQGAQTWWLSDDIRLIQVAEGGTQFGVQMGNDPFAFLSAVTSALNAGQGLAGNQSFDTNTQEDSEVLTVAPQNAAGQNVYNFAIARVHYQGMASTAKSVRVFFRLFAANSTATDFQPTSSYERYPSVYPVPNAQFFQNVLPTSGVSAGEYISVPCFGEARQDATQPGPANSLPSLQTPDGFNVRDLQPTGGPLHDTFYGCWLDINQPLKADGVTPNNVVPAQVPPGNEDGPWPPSTGVSLEPLQTAFIVNEHQCLVAEIAFDPDPIDTGTQPFNSDKLAQRNISWSYVANPGEAASRQALEPFEVRPTPPSLGADELPDELMIDWTNVPVGQNAELYLPAVDADAVLQRAAELYRTLRLTRVDAHTIGCVTGGVSYIPLPKGSGNGANFVGLISVNLPYGIKKGQNYTVIVRQLTNAAGSQPPPPPQIAAARSEVVGPTPIFKWRRVLGTFQINIPVSTKELLLPREEQRLSIFRWIGEAMSPQRRWYPVFQRYLEGIANRVRGLGGDPTEILPSPTGDGGHKPPVPKPPPVSKPLEKRLRFTGKIAGLIFDRFGDFEGFLLNTEDDERAFHSREKDLEELAEHAWRERLRITVWAERHEPHRPLSIIVREPPAPFGH